MVVAALVAVAALAGCGDDDDPSIASGETTTTVAVADGLRPFPTGVAPIPAPGEAPADGEHGVEIQAVDLDGRTITVDVIEFLVGDEADAAYADDGGDGEVPNDYYIRNTDTDAQALDVADDVAVTLVDMGAQRLANEEATFDALPAHLDEVPSPYWITVEAGVVVAIDQQFVP